MKSYILQILVGLMVFNCTAQEIKKGYVIKGDIANIPAKRIYINIPKNYNRKNVWVNIDSALIINNKFVLSKDTLFAEPAWAANLFYIDSISNKRTTIHFLNAYKSPGQKSSIHTSFILENAAIFLNGDLKKQKGVSINGAKETDFLMKYGFPEPLDLSAINKVIDSLKTEPTGTASILARTQKKELIQSYKDNYKKMIIENKGTWLVLKSLYQHANAFKPEELEGLTKLFDHKLMETITGKQLTNYIHQGKLLAISKNFIDFNYADANLKKFNLNSVKGKNGTLIIFWASWCGPCRAEIPELKEFYRTYTNQGIGMVSISADHDVASWKKALEEEKMPWINLGNLPGNFKEITAKYNVTAIPAMFLLDKDNKIILADPNNFDLVKQKTQDLLK